MNLNDELAPYGFLAAFFGALASFGWLIPIAGYLLSMVAIYMGVKGSDAEDNGMAIAGLTLGMMAFVLTFIRSGLVFLYG